VTRCLYTEAAIVAEVAATPELEALAKGG